MEKQMNKPNLFLIGLLQAVGVVVYCGLVSGLLSFSKNFFAEPVGFLGSVLLLVLFVFSAAVSGSIVFGYASYLALNKKIKQALSVLTYTLLCSLGIIAIMIIVLSIF